MASLEGRRSLIVGGGSGIGRAVVDAYVHAGARVVVLELDPEKCAEIARSQPTVCVIRGDACVLADCRAAIEACKDGLGGLDLLVNCVGVFDFYRGLEAIDPESLPMALEEIYRVNVLSQLLSTRLAIPLLRDSKGAVILTSSSSGFYPGRGGILYVGSKFAVRGSTISLAHELAPDIRVNCVAPGGVLGTDLRGSASLGQADRRMSANAERVDNLKQLTPLRLAMTPEDIAGSYVFLGSDAALGMSGEFLHPNGGMGLRS